jgi:short-subunit dehydrogenase
MKTIVITGANQGIGLSLTQEGVKKGFQVLAIDVELKNLENQKNILPYKIDISNPNEFLEFEEWYKKKFSTPPSLWINNAGIATPGSFENITSEQFDRILDVNLKGTVYGTRCALILQKTSPHSPIKIVNISSMNGIIPAPFMSAYSASKHGIVGFTRSLQLEFEQKKEYAIKFLLILPGFVSTPMTETHKNFQLPQWIKKNRDSPEKVAQEIWCAIENNSKEKVVTRNGKIMERFYRIFPNLTSKSSRLLTAKDWREALGLDPIEKD